MPTACVDAQTAHRKPPAASGELSAPSPAATPQVVEHVQSTLRAGNVIGASDSLYGTCKTDIRFVHHGGPGKDENKEKNRSVFKRSGDPFISALRKLGMTWGSASTAHCDRKRKDGHGRCVIHSYVV